MKLLLDANVSWRLIKPLKKYFEIIEHVDSNQLISPARDSEIWKYAKSNNFIILTNDDDFLNLSISKGYPPKVVLLRSGNQSTVKIKNLIIQHIDAISRLYNEDKIGVLEIL